MNIDRNYFCNNHFSIVDLCTKMIDEQCFSLPLLHCCCRSERNVFPGRTSMVVNDPIRRNTTIYMIQYHDRILPCRIRTPESSIWVFQLSLINEDTREIWKNGHEGKKYVCMNYSEYIQLFIRLLARRYTYLPFDDNLRKKRIMIIGLYRDRRK